MRIKHLVVCASVLGFLAGSYSRSRADYVFAEQTVTPAVDVTTHPGADLGVSGTATTSSFNTVNQSIVLPPGPPLPSQTFTGTLDAGQAFVGSQALTPPPENQFTPAGPTFAGDFYARADSRGTNPQSSPIPAFQTTAQVVAEASTDNLNTLGQTGGTADWTQTIPFRLSSSTNIPIRLSALFNNSLNVAGFLSGGSFHFDATIIDASGGRVQLSNGSFAWRPGALNQGIGLNFGPVGGGTAGGSCTVSIETVPVPQGDYTLVVHDFSTALAVPEPPSLVLGSTAFLGLLGGYAWHRRRRAVA